MQDPERYFGQRLKLCGDLTTGVETGLALHEPRPGYLLLSSGGEGSLMHGRMGLFLPPRRWLAGFMGKRICVIGVISHRDGKTPASIARQGYREVTSGAVDSQWHFGALYAQEAR